MSTHPIKVQADPSLCVLCGAPNDCVMARKKLSPSVAPQADAPCWCLTAIFPKNLTTQATEKDGGAACICQSCLTFQSTPTD